MNNSSFPRILILGHQFDNFTGLGITLGNLFANWPKEKLAIMAPLIDIEKCEASRPCGQYICQHSKPLINFGRKGIKKILREWTRKSYYYLGLSEIKYEFPYNDSEIAEAISFNPNIVFCCLGTYNSMRSCHQVMKFIPQAKLVLYIVDDWVNSKENNRLFSNYWRNKNDKLFRKLIDSASGLLSICPYMTEVYKQKYNKTFIPFHNPVDCGFWNSLSSVRKYEPEVNAILYVGKINVDTKQCLLDMAEAVQSLNERGKSHKRYVLDIYTPDYYNNQEIFGANDSCHIYPAVPHNEIPSLMKSYDALLLTLGFAKTTQDYVRLSMPTKVSEYLASGIPVILYCPAGIALAKYLGPKECTINCFERDHQKLSSAISKLEDVRFCNELSTKSLELARNHDTIKVRAEFEKVINNF